MSTARIVIDAKIGDAPPRSAGLPRRGLLVAIIVVGIGACLARPSSGEPISWSNGAILAAMAVAAVLGASESRRLVAAQQARNVEDEPAREVVGPWLTVRVNPAGPADTAGVDDRPKSPTRDDPERRSLVRRAEERVPAGASRR